MVIFEQPLDTRHMEVDIGHPPTQVTPNHKNTLIFIADVIRIHYYAVWLDWAG